MFNFLLHISANHKFVFLTPQEISSCLWWDWTWSTRVTRSFSVVPANIYTDNQADPADQDLYIELYHLFEIQLFVPNLQKMSELRDVFPPNLLNCFIK